MTSTSQHLSFTVEELQRLLERYTNAFGMILWRVFSVDLVNFFIRVYRESRDGAKTFSAPRVISSMPCGDSPNDRRAQRRFPTYGDYYGVVPTPDGGFRLLWPEMQSGGSVLVTTIVPVP